MGQIRWCLVNVYSRLRRPEKLYGITGYTISGRWGSYRMHEPAILERTAAYNTAYYAEHKEEEPVAGWQAARLQVQAEARPFLNVRAAPGKHGGSVTDEARVQDGYVWRHIRVGAKESWAASGPEDRPGQYMVISLLSAPAQTPADVTADVYRRLIAALSLYRDLMDAIARQAAFARHHTQEQIDDIEAVVAGLEGGCERTEDKSESCLIAAQQYAHGSSLRPVRRRPVGYRAVVDELGPRGSRPVVTGDVSKLL